MFHRTATCLRKVRITIPQLSPTHTKAKILRWCLPQQQQPISSHSIEVQDYDPLMVLECSADLITKGYRESDNHQPLMIIEVQEEGILKINNNIKLNQWYDVGTPIGEIDDGDDDDEENNFDADWIWQAYSYSSEDEK